jgi:hypothetical protein
MAQVVIVTGMHRSGTSLVASLIQAAGAHLGEELLAANVANPRGYFEDLDFYKFHEQLLHRRSQSYLYVHADFSFEPTTADVERAQRLIAGRSDRRLWGWKDPRTALFLPFWHQLLPQARFLFVYRHPFEVLMSLLRRGEFNNHPCLEAGLHAWQLYNNNIKSFYDQHADMCLLVHIDRAIGDVAQFAQLLQQKLELNLQLDSDVLAQIYHAQEMHRTPHSVEITEILRKLCPGLLELYDRLNAEADLPVATSESRLDSTAQLSSLAKLSETLSVPLSIPLRHSLLELLVSLVAPGPSEAMLQSFYQNIEGAQRSIDYLWLQLQQSNRANHDYVEMLEQQAELEALHTQLKQQRVELGQQAVRIQSLRDELNRIYQNRTWKLIQSV